MSSFIKCVPLSTEVGRAAFEAMGVHQERCDNSYIHLLLCGINSLCKSKVVIMLKRHNLNLTIRQTQIEGHLQNNCPVTFKNVDVMVDEV